MGWRGAFGRRGEERPAAGMDTDAPETVSPPASTGRNLVHAADHNLRITLEAIRRSGSLARSDLARLTGLSEPGVGNILKQLVKAGLVEKAGRVGRASGFGLAEDAAFGLGIDVAKDGITAVVIDLRGSLRMRRRFHAAGDDVAALREATLRCVGARADRLAGCGISLGDDVPPAVLGRVEPFLASLPARSVMRDADAAALGELLFGPFEAGSFACLLIDRTIRAGIVIEGRLFRGVSGRAGRLGRMRVDEDGSVLDAAAGAGTMPGFPFDDDAATASRPASEAWLDGAVPRLMDAVVALSGFLGPAAVLVGGRLPRAMLVSIADRLRRERGRRVGHPRQPHWLPRIAPASLGRDGAAIGAAATSFFSRLLPDPRH